ncbi:MAG TPA: DNA polymerase III subunit delta' [Wenzhouxiangella sp.]|nr:DNA polymerase III subunit delta' [Wenzhouxiangella sp.]
MKLPSWLDESADALWQRYRQQRLGHAPLVYGPEGVGKQLLGRWLAALLLCSGPDDGQPCGRCDDCRLVQSGSHPDFLVIEPEEDRQVVGVNQVRELIDGLHLTSTRDGNRVGLLPRADSMNVNAANALLKTLEEPPAGTWLILVTSKPAILPATIYSRCQPVAVRQPTHEAARTWLANACPDIAADRLEAALRFCELAPLAARDMLESGDLDTGMAVLEDLVEVRPHAEIIERWLESPMVSWRWICRWLHVIMTNTGSSAAWKPAAVRLPTGFDERKLMQLWELALHGHRESQRGVVRQDLLFGRWLLEWQLQWQSAQPAGS